MRKGLLLFSLAMGATGAFAAESAWSIQESAYPAEYAGPITDAAEGHAEHSPSTVTRFTQVSELAQN